MGEIGGFGSGGDCGFPEGIVFVVGDYGSGGVQVFRNVSVPIEGWEIRSG